MASVNKVIIMGRLGADPELRYTQNQTAVATLNVATTEYRTGQDGQRQESTEWHRVVVWNKQAENCSRYLTKGSGVFVEGRLQTRNWEDQNGQKRYTTEIVGNNVQFLPRSNQPNSGQSQETPSDFGGGFAPSPSSNGASKSFQDQSGGFPQAQQPSAPAGGGSQPSSVMDDIPFLSEDLEFQGFSEFL